jgi:glycerophosphoryl diester phosphodiesterase
MSQVTDCFLVTPLVIAHRGACWDAPENTFEAFELAIAEEADYVEFDVRARDGELVVCHDPKPPEDAPRFDDVLASLAGRAGIAVEIKEPETTAAVLDALDAHAVEADQTMVVSFHVAALEAVRRRRPEIACIFHVREKDPAAAAGFWGVGFEEPTAEERIRAAQAVGLATTVFTVNDAERIAELGRLGVSGIFTDRPGLARQALRAAR